MVSLKAESLTHRFADGTLALDRVDLSIQPGEFVALAGANGCGKTTLLRHFNGLLRPTSGDVLVDGVSVKKDPARARRLVGMVFQDADTQIVGETVYEDVAFGPRNLGLSAGEIRYRATTAITSVGLEGMDERRPHQLSGGRKRRLAVAGILAMNARAVLLDEPFSNLDWPGIHQVREQLAALKRSGRTVIVISHDLERVLDMADRLVVMAGGRIVRDGVPAEVMPGIEAYGVREPGRPLPPLGARPTSGLNFTGPAIAAAASSFPAMEAPCPA